MCHRPFLDRVVTREGSKVCLPFSLWSLKGKYMDIEFDFKGSPLGGVITNCMCLPILLTAFLFHLPHSVPFC